MNVEIQPFVSCNYQILVVPMIVSPIKHRAIFNRKMVVQSKVIQNTGIFLIDLMYDW